MKIIVAIMLFFAVGVPLSFYNGVIIADAWNWFVKDYFGLAPISILHGWGILLCVTCFNIFNNVKEAITQKTDGDQLKSGLVIQLTYALALVITHTYLWTIHTLFF